MAWLSGFTGSSGLAIVLAEHAAIFVDGRYSLAVKQQVDLAVFTPVPLTQTSPRVWLETNLRPGMRLGYDPWLHTPRQVEGLEKGAKAAGAELVAVESNPIDAIWRERPPPPLGKIILHPQKYAGETAKSKLARVVGAFGTATALLVSDPHAAAWAFNIRGSDVAHTPLPLCCALIFKDTKPRLYVDGRKLDPRVRTAIEALARVQEPDRLIPDLAALGREGRKVLLDCATVPVKLVTVLREAGGIVEIGDDPIALMKARKNATELKGARNAQLRDGVAVVSFLHWLSVNARSGKISEIEAAQALESFRRATGKLKDLSFPSISAAGAHAAIPHYRVTNKANARIRKGIFLIDSGGQYEDGTTDITRTVAIGRPNALMRDRFTRVLKGHIAIARAIFPKGTTGAQLDTLARTALWQAGADFDHGTGHGVGSYLSVHEGPQRISKLGTTALETGMILSNEPAYYRSGEWGIRTENLIAVERRMIAGEEHEMLGFETLTLVPIDRALIEPKLLDDGEIAWLNSYHARVRREISPLVEPAVRRWLNAATVRIGRR